MASLFRNSRIILTKVSCISRTAATTSTSGGGTGVRPSGTSTNLSETSRAADGTDMAMKDAKQRGTSSGSSGSSGSFGSSGSSGSSGSFGSSGSSGSSGTAGSKSTGQSSSTPNTGKPSVPWGMIAGIVLAVGGYFVYTNYIKNPGHANATGVNRELSRAYNQEPTTNPDKSTGKKH